MSVINFEKKFIFIHITKNAGTSMEKFPFLSNVTSKHFGIGYYYFLAENKIWLNFNPKKFWKFAFVRNPYTRLASAVLQHHLKGDVFLFSEFNCFLIENRKRLTTDWLVTKPQYTFCCHDGKMVMDFIGKFENLQNDWKKVCRYLGVKKCKLPHVNKGKGYGVDYMGLYNDETKKLVQEVYKKDFELFDYEK